ncbi:PfkB family carbohydrate kinase [Cypionkella sp.]|uniref:PfkB family carbohydrate kinase n=1 Tax=Cypionkella sp. TaxID=2811411 RepID=UPI002614D69A|nr:PfkB family carbohydrate kinase [Cypionkella sp.]MDB5666772.1 Ribokinase [Cypionkella sp.]
MIKIAAMGDNVVDCYLSKGTMFPGGNCLNVSVFIRRFGGVSAYIGAIGQDEAGSVIEKALHDENVDLARLRILKGATAYCVIGHRDADRVFVRADLGVSMFSPSSEDIAFLKDFAAVHIGQSSGLDDHVSAAAAQTLLSYDFSTRRDPEHRRTIAPLCFLASISGGDLSHDEALAIAAELRDCGARWVLVTRGSEGAILLGAEGLFEVAASPADLVDTLGAGDTFIARTLFGLIAGETPHALLSAAAVAAAETCRYFGAVGHGAPIKLSGVVPELQTISS